MRVFIEKGRIQILQSRFNFDTPLPPEDGWNKKKNIKKKRKWRGKALAIGLSELPFFILRKN